MGSDDDPGRPGRELAETVTIAAGRLLLDLPGEATVRYGRQAYHEAGGFIRSLPVPDPAQAEERVLAQVQALAVAHEEGGSRLEWLAQARRSSSWFLYYWKDTFFKGDRLEANGFHWLDGVLFQLRSQCPAGAVAEHSQRWEAVLRSLRRRRGEVPAEPGFSIGHGFFPGGPEPTGREQLELHVRFPSQPLLRLRLSSDTLGESVAESPRPGARLRRIGSLLGQECRQTRPDRGGAAAWLWETPGRPRDPRAPRVVLELSAAIGREPAFALDLAEELWERTLASLRLYPLPKPLETRADPGAEVVGASHQLRGP